MSEIAYECPRCEKACAHPDLCRNCGWGPMMIHAGCRGVVTVNDDLDTATCDRCGEKLSLGSGDNRYARLWDAALAVVDDPDSAEHRRSLSRVVQLLCPFCDEDGHIELDLAGEAWMRRCTHDPHFEREVGRKP